MESIDAKSHDYRQLFKEQIVRYWHDFSYMRDLDDLINFAARQKRLYTEQEVSAS
jgi:hypothetical protein